MKAIRFLRRLVRSPMTTIFGAGEIFEEGEAAYNRKDYRAALEKWRLIAEQGNTPAQVNLGHMYDHGEGVEKDHSEAEKCYRAAASKGDMFAEYALGSRYYSGIGGNQSFEEAANWYQKAAQQGYDVAQADLGALYETGEGIPQDLEEATSWYIKAAKQGNPNAQTNLGRIHFNAENFEQAEMWWRKAALGGNASAAGNIGVLYANGYGVSADAIKAIAWSIIGTKLGSNTASNNLQEFSIEVSPAQITEAEKLADKWFAGFEVTNSRRN